MMSTFECYNIACSNCYNRVCYGDNVTRNNCEYSLRPIRKEKTEQESNRKGTKTDI